MDIDTDFGETQRAARRNRRRVWLSCMALLACALMIADLAWQANADSETGVRQLSRCCTAETAPPPSPAFKTASPTLLSP